jgi:hypothetical protein
VKASSVRFKNSNKPMAGTQTKTFIAGVRGIAVGGGMPSATKQ